MMLDVFGYCSIVASNFEWSGCVEAYKYDTICSLYSKRNLLFI